MKLILVYTYIIRIISKKNLNSNIIQLVSLPLQARFLVMIISKLNSQTMTNPSMHAEQCPFQQHFHRTYSLSAHFKFDLFDRPFVRMRQKVTKAGVAVSCWGMVGKLFYNLRHDQCSKQRSTWCTCAKSTNIRKNTGNCSRIWACDLFLTHLQQQRMPR